jgi:hypothetical protein
MRLTKALITDHCFSICTNGNLRDFTLIVEYSEGFSDLILRIVARILLGHEAVNMYITYHCLSTPIKTPWTTLTLSNTLEASLISSLALSEYLLDMRLRKALKTDCYPGICDHYPGICTNEDLRDFTHTVKYSEGLSDLVLGIVVSVLL